MPSTGPVTACLRISSDSARTLSMQPVPPDHLDDGADQRAGHGSAAEGRAQVAGLERVGQTRSSGAALQGKPPPSALAVVSMSGFTLVQVRREGRARAADAALHLIDDEQCAGPPAGGGDRRTKPGARSKAPARPCTSSMMTAAVSPLMQRFSAAMSSRGMNSHVERRARKAVPALRRPPGHGGGRGRPAVEAVLQAPVPASGP